VEGSLLGTTHGANGTTQVTYNHWPLYTFSGDSKPGQAKGQGLEGTWYAVTAAGAEAHASSTAPASSSTTTASANSGSGY
jgi:hypothetical protein